MLDAVVLTSLGTETEKTCQKASLWKEARGAGQKGTKQLHELFESTHGLGATLASTYDS